MAISISEKYLKGFISDNEINSLSKNAYDAFDTLFNGSGEGNDYLGWVNLPTDYDKEEYARIKEAAKKIRNSCDVFVVLGIGGSYLGARAAIEFLKSQEHNELDQKTPDIYFAGNSISSTSLNDLLKICEGKDICVNVISKSGTTTETAVAFRVFQNLLVKKYGKDEAAKRIFATTDKSKGTLKKFSDESGFETFVVPDPVGGRYSVLTAVGLLPIAVAGIELDDLMKGAQDAQKAFAVKDINNNAALRYAVLRNALYQKGKKVEILVGYEPYQLLVNEWWKQLYGESEGKDQKGIFPASVIFSTDLHSMGQYIQEGERHIFETVLSIKDSHSSFEIPYDEANIDGLNFLAGKSLDYVQKQAMQATLLAHYDGGVPNILLELDDRSAYSLGYLFYFFEIACGFSGYMLKVNPFNQPGVESYKKNMFALLGKPGYEDLMQDIKKRLN